MSELFAPIAPKKRDTTAYDLWRAGWPGLNLGVPIGTIATYSNGRLTHLNGEPL